MALYCFDGTWNIDEEEDEKDTNVVRFKELYQGQNCSYLGGVGTRFGAVGKVLGGTFGIGGRSRIEEMLGEVETNFNREDQIIDIIGYSRGAALAVHFSNKLAEVGIRLESGEVIPASIRFLGLWDVVGSFGLSFDNIIDFQKINLGWDIDRVADSVQHCFHAMAMDERRESFGLTRLDPRDKKNTIEEVWFRGVHGDLGGSAGNPKRSNIALNWMLDKAIDCGLPIDISKRKKRKYSDIDLDAKISENKDIKVDPRRKIEASDKIHESAHSRELDVGQECDFVTRAKSRFNWSRVKLVKGQEYQITVKQDSMWKDGDIECDADGWPTEDLPFYKELVIQHFEDNRRCPQAHWFELIGSYGSDSTDPFFRIGKEVTFKAVIDADLYTFANDLNNFYSNNKGKLAVKIKRLS